eukprot:258298_1
MYNCNRLPTTHYQCTRRYNDNQIVSRYSILMKKMECLTEGRKVCMNGNAIKGTTMTKKCIANHMCCGKAFIASRSLRSDTTIYDDTTDSWSPLFVYQTLKPHIGVWRQYPFELVSSLEVTCVTQCNAEYAFDMARIRAVRRTI